VRAGPTLVSLALASASFGQAPGPPTFPTDARLVTIDVLALDRAEKPVPGLTASDVVVTEDGVPQDVARFEAFDRSGDAPPSPERPADGVATSLRTSPRGARTFVLLVDDLGLAASRQVDVRRAIERLADDGLRDGDELLFLTTSGEIAWSARMPEGREDVRALAARVRGRRLGEPVSDSMTEWEAFRITRLESPTGASLESSGIGLTPEGPPTGAVPVTLPPGASATERVVARWLERRVVPARGRLRVPVARRRPGPGHRPGAPTARATSSPASTRPSSPCPPSGDGRPSS
jgi:hypothetical protein